MGTAQLLFKDILRQEIPSDVYNNNYATQRLQGRPATRNCVTERGDASMILTAFESSAGVRGAMMSG